LNKKYQGTLILRL